VKVKIGMNLNPARREMGLMKDADVAQVSEVVSRAGYDIM
jgi:hypothetical protein